MKKRETVSDNFFTSIIVLGTLGLMSAAFIAGTYVEQALLGLPDRVNFRQCLPWFAVFSLTTMYFNSVFDFTRRKHHLLFSAFTSIVLANLLMMALPFFEALYYVRISTVAIIFTMEYLFVSAWILVTHRLWRKKHPPVPSVLFCADKQRGMEIARKINSMGTTNRIDLVVRYDEADFPGIVDRFESIFLDAPPPEVKNNIAFYSWEKKKELIIIPDICDLLINNATLIQFDDIMVYRAKPIGLTLEQRFFKRAIDIIGSALALVILSPLMLVIAILIKRDGGPVFYTQKRVTRGGREFDLYKFRTMIPDAEKLTGPVLAQKDDPRVTKIGKKLRQTRLDEIPQLWNTLKGDMSLVGPRPEREHFIELYKESIPEYEYRTFVRAGITGLAHVFGKYNTTPEERIKLDLTYMQNYSIFLDLKIMIETLRVIFTKDYAEGVEQSSGAEKAAAPGKTEKAAVKQAAAQATNPATGKAAGQAAWETVGHMEKRAVNLTGNPAAKPPVRQRKGKA